MFTASLLLAASLAVGQNDESPVYEYLKDLEAFVGSWEAQSVVPEAPGASESLKKWAGKTVLLRMTVRWAPGKAAQIVELVDEIPGDRTIMGTSLIGWDQSAKGIRERILTTHKGIWAGKWNKMDDQSWVVEYTGVNLDGAKCTCTTEYKFVDKDTFTVTDSQKTIDGQPFPDTAYQYKRVGKAPEVSNYDRLKELEFLTATGKPKERTALLVGPFNGQKIRTAFRT